MRDFQQRRPMRMFFASRPVLIILFLLLIGAGITSFRVLLQGLDVVAERRSVEEKLRNAEVRQEALSSELENLQSERGIEREAREKLNYRKPGEEVVIILENDNTAHIEENTENASFWGTIKRWINLE